ncbi:hypothetical protein AK812_SmicGene10141 [Symbiodinium microadriaticum]|uniref:Uncharacterized protein n=1 Tax=Symbiodinium microadriaticum TaxID=2951 RepID=A0A1Q9EGD4_SYMMI|nr:hypothetical protein AK812_SmicGene10141 [Symbiodinium microadriaticum]
MRNLTFSDGELKFKLFIQDELVRSPVDPSGWMLGWQSLMKHRCIHPSSRRDAPEELRNEDLELLAPMMRTPEALSEDGWGPQPEASDVLGRLARSRFYTGQRRPATELADKETNSTQLEACEVATKVLMANPKTSDEEHEMEAFMELRLVCGVMRHCNVEAMVNETHIKSVAEVVGYAGDPGVRHVGLIMKERGMVLEAASRLYRKALALAPDHGSLCLNLMHTFALRRDDIRGLAWARKFFGDLASFQARYQSEDVLFAVNVWKDAIAIGFVVLKLLFLAHPRTPLPFCQAAIRGDGVLCILQIRRLRDVEVSEEIVGPQDVWRRPPEAVNAGAPRLGAIAAHDQVLRWLVALRLGPSAMRCASRGLELHLTAVRNENAYFNCIKDILALKSPATIPRSPALFRYVIGDSHVLPTSWQTVEFTTSRGSYHYVLIPMLVTGLKIWHLRDESNFYTKFILGEIDCREGVLKAVQKDDMNKAGSTVNVMVWLCRTWELLGGFLTLAFNSLLSAAPCQAALAKVRSGSILNFLAAALFPRNPSYVQTHLAPAMQRTLETCRVSDVRWVQKSPEPARSLSEAALNAAAAWKGRQIPQRETVLSGHRTTQSPVWLTSMHSPSRREGQEPTNMRPRTPSKTFPKRGDDSVSIRSTTASSQGDRSQSGQGFTKPSRRK